MTAMAPVNDPSPAPGTAGAAVEVPLPWWRRALARLALPPAVALPLPVLPVAWWLTAGVLPAGLVVVTGAGVPAAVATGALLALAGLLAWPGWWRWAWLPLLLGVGLSLLHAWAPWRSYPQYLYGGEGSAEIEAVCTDLSLSRLAWRAADGPKLSAEVQLRRLRLGPREPWHDVGGTVRLRPAPAALRYGQTLHAVGAFRQPWSTGVAGGFDYPQYLRGHGIRHVFQAGTAEITQAEPQGARRLVAVLPAVRDWFVARLAAGVPQAEDQAVLAALTVGFMDGLPPAAREVYVRSGTIHLFSVSGMNVSVLFGLLVGLLLVLRVPFGLRQVLGPLVLLGFVLVTGAEPPAMRAWLMLSIWSLGRGWRRPTVSLNAVLVAGVLLVLWQPFALFDIGFQYSFIIVISLILGWQLAQRWQQWWRESRRWVPARVCYPRPWPERFTDHAYRALGATVAAWLGSVALTAWNNQLFQPLGAPVNLAIGLLVGPLYGLSLLKVVVAGWVPAGAEHALAVLLGWLSTALRALAAAGAADGWVLAVPKPPLAAVVVFHGVLVALFACRGALRTAMALVVTLTVVLAALLLGGRSTAGVPAAAVLVPASSVAPVVVLRLPGLPATAPVLIGTGDAAYGFRLREWLRVHGVSQLEALVLLDDTLPYAGAAADLLGVVRTRSVVLLAERGPPPAHADAAAPGESARAAPPPAARPGAYPPRPDVRTLLQTAEQSTQATWHRAYRQADLLLPGGAWHKDEALLQKHFCGTWQVADGGQVQLELTVTTHQGGTLVLRRRTAAADAAWANLATWSWTLSNHDRQQVLVPEWEY